MAMGHVLRTRSTTNTSKPLYTYAALVLQCCLMAREWWREHHEKREGDVDESDDEENCIAESFHVCDMQFWDAQHRNNFFPSEASMCHENQHAEYVETGPNLILKELILQRIDITYTSRRNGSVVGPEQIQRQNSPEVDEVSRRADATQDFRYFGPLGTTLQGVRSE